MSNWKNNQGSNWGSTARSSGTRCALRNQHIQVSQSTCPDSVSFSLYCHPLLSPHFLSAGSFILFAAYWLLLLWSYLRPEHSPASHCKHQLLLKRVSECQTQISKTEMMSVLVREGVNRSSCQLLYPEVVSEKGSLPACPPSCRALGSRCWWEGMDRFPQKGRVETEGLPLAEACLGQRHCAECQGEHHSFIPELFTGCLFCARHCSIQELWIQQWQERQEPCPPGSLILHTKILRFSKQGHEQENFR